MFRYWMLVLAVVSLVFLGCGEKSAVPRNAPAVEQIELASNGAKAAPAFGGAKTSPLAGEDRMKPASKSEPHFNTETYDRIVDNTFQATASSPLSTFATDVDTASMSNISRYIDSGSLPPKDAVRIEEMINYFKYNYPKPSGSHPIGISTEVGTCPWKPEHWLLKIGMNTKSLDPNNIPARNLVFLIDVSGSMGPENRLPLLKQGLQLLVPQLTSKDRVAIVVYASSSGLVLPATPGNRHAEIIASLNQLNAGGSTNGGEGIQLAYKVAKENYISGGVNRVILATDGDFNVGVTSQGDLTRMIESHRRDNIFLTVLGFGMGNLKDSTLEKLADLGNGHYAYIDTYAEMEKVFVTDGATLVAVAKDVKIQVEFNPKVVQAYRLIGYENRVMANKDFHDDNKSGGAIGAGHTVTAFYELVPHGVKIDLPQESKLRYQDTKTINKNEKASELAFVKIRYKDPEAEKSQLFDQAIATGVVPFGDCTKDFRFAAGLACFGMILRDSPHKAASNYQLVHNLLRSGRGEDPGGIRQKWLPMIERTEELQGKKTLQ